MNPIDKIPPQALDIEEVVLGALMLESEAYSRISNLLSVNSFYHHLHGIIFKAIKSLHDAGNPIDIMTVTQALKASNELDKVGGPFFIVQLTSRVASTAHLEHHALIIAQAAIRREIIRSASLTIQKAYDESIELDETLSEIKNSLNEIENIAANHSGSGQSQALTLKMALEEIEQDCVSVNKGKTPGIVTGLQKLDKYTGGWRPTNLIILAARPGVGKTSLALHFALCAAKAGKHVDFYSMEMNSQDLMRIIIAGESEVNRSAIRDGKIQDSDWKSIDKSVTNLEKLPIVWYDHGLTAHQIAANTRKNVKSGNCELVVIDYLQILSPTDKKAIREQQISEMTRTLKMTALENNVPVICLSQLNRSVEMRASDKQPQLSDLRESGAIEQDADIVVMPFRDTESTYYLKIAKNRRGQTGVIKINANEQMTKFFDEDPKQFQSMGEPRQFHAIDENAPF